MKRFFLSCSFLTILSLLASCTYTGGIENPLIRKFSWFSYLNGDDIRKVCSSLGSDKLRLIYNGIYQEQVRIYDVSFLSKKMTTRVIGTPNIQSFTLEDIGEIVGGQTVDLRLSDTELGVFKALAQSNIAAQQIPKGSLLNSNDFYWTIQYCSEGQFTLNLKEVTIDDWEQFELGKFAFDLDVSGIEVNKPRKLTPYDIYELNEYYNDFNVQMGDNALVGFNKS